MIDDYWGPQAQHCAKCGRWGVPRLQYQPARPSAGEVARAMVSGEVLGVYPECLRVICGTCGYYTTRPCEDALPRESGYIPSSPASPESGRPRNG
jgi:hypothetical protein